MQVTVCIMGRVDLFTAGGVGAAVVGAGMFLLGIVAWQWGWGVDVVQALSTVSPGYGPTLQGSFTGMFWGAVDGAVFGVLIGYLYSYGTR